MWTLQDLSTICWSLAKLNIGNRKLLDLIYNRIVVDIPVLSAKDISYQLWGFAVLGYPLQSQVLATYWVSQPTLLPYCAYEHGCQEYSQGPSEALVHANGLWLSEHVPCSIA